MCLLTAFPLPDMLDSATEKRLYNGADCNPHGSGWAVVSNGRILVGKSMDEMEAVKGFREAYRHATGPALFHSRWATHGDKSIANVHPFPMRGFDNTYVAHNGIMPAECYPEKGDDRSDTRVFADEILPYRFKRLDKPGVRHALEKWLGYNKIAVLSTNPRLHRNLYLFGTEMGEWVDGVWFSNNDHEGWSKYLNRHYKANETCFWCNTESVNVWAICESCGTCQDCFEPSDHCECFIPDATQTQRPDEEPDPTTSVAFAKATATGGTKPLAIAGKVWTPGEKDWKTDAEATNGFPCVIGPKVSYDPATQTERAAAIADETVGA